jgi:hypothetical protein
MFSYQIVTTDWSLPDEAPQSNPFDPNATTDWDQNMSTGAAPTTETGLDAALSAALAARYGEPVCAQLIGNTCYL